MRDMAGVAAVLVVLSAVVLSAYATDYPVGDSQGWTQNVDYSTWASGNTFKVNDSLVFKYTSQHTVVEVNKADYDKCSIGNPIKTYTDGNTKISLLATGNRYFICGTQGHCDGGMKVAIPVTGSTPITPSPPSPPPSTPSPGGGPSTPLTPPPPPPPPKNGATCGFDGGNVVLLGVLAVGLALLG